MSESVSSAPTPGEFEPPASAVNDGEILDAEFIDESGPTPGTALELHDPTVIQGEAITNDEYKAYKDEARSERVAQATEDRRERLRQRREAEEAWGTMSDAEFGRFTQVASEVGKIMLSQEQGLGRFNAIFDKVQERMAAQKARESSKKAEMAEARNEDARTILRRVQIDALHNGKEKEADQFKLMIEHGDEKLYKDVNKVIEEASRARNDLKRWNTELTDEQATAQIVEMFGQRAEAEMAKSETLQNAGTIRRAHLLKTLTAGGTLSLPFMSERELIAKL
jgi:hypothetical protein